jgi:peroxiredoxin Q/BCP
VLNLLRTAATMVGAAVSGTIHRASGRGGTAAVQLQPGDLAPDFSLQGSDGHWYRLRDLRSRVVVVLAWFPKAFTPGCAKECKSLGSNRAALKQFSARYFGASLDAPDTSRRFAESLGIDYPILSDPDGSVARAYGVVGPWGLPSRWTFYIGMDGRIIDIDKQVQVTTHGHDVAVRLNELGVPRQASGLRAEATGES